MTIFGKIKEVLSGHPTQAKGAVDKAGDFIDHKTGGKYTDQIDQAEQKASDYIDGLGQQGNPPAAEEPPADTSTP